MTSKTVGRETHTDEPGRLAKNLNARTVAPIVASETLSKKSEKPSHRGSTKALKSPRGTATKPTRGTEKRFVTKPARETLWKWYARAGAVPTMAATVTRNISPGFSANLLLHTTESARVYDEYQKGGKGERVKELLFPFDEHCKDECTDHYDGPLGGQRKPRYGRVEEDRDHGRDQGDLSYVNGEHKMLAPL
jgi:hypothetical protein